TAPGEFEVAGVLITGLRIRPRDKSSSDDRSQRNIAFVFDIDDIRVCHLGDLRQAPHADDVEPLVGTDILLIPVGGGPTLDARSAAETVSLLEPKIVIPMRYKTAVSTSQVEGVEKFLKEMAA